MRKYLILFILLAVTPLLNAQKKVKFGVFVEPKISWLSPESRDVTSEGVNWGFGGGLEIDRYFDKNYAFSTGISLGSQGGKLLYNKALTLTVYDEPDTLPGGTTLEYNLQYLTIPFGLKLKSNQIGYSTFFVNVGFTSQINMKAKGTSNNIGGIEGDAIKDEINWINLGYHFGGGVEYALGEDTALSVGIQYQNGFLDITKQEPRTLSRVLALRVGIMF